MSKATVARMGADLTCNSTSFNKNIENSRKYMRRAANDMGNSARKVDKGISGSFSNAARNVAIIQGPLGGVSGRLSSLAASISSVGVAATAAGALIGTSTLVTMKAAQVSDRYNLSAKKTEALLKATGQASGFTKQQIRELSEELALATLASVEGTEKAAQKLLTFRSISGDVFRRTLELSQDLAELGFGTVDSSAVQLGKALEDPINGLTALRRIGVSFSEVQKQQIRGFVETNDLARAQKLILDALSDQIGGASKAAADSMAGAQDTLNQRMDEFLKSIDKVTGASEGLKDAYQDVADFLYSFRVKIDFDSIPLEQQQQVLQHKITNAQKKLQQMLDAGQGKGKFYLFGDNPVENIKKEVAEFEKQMEEVSAKLREKVAEEKDARKKAAFEKEQTASENRMASLKKKVDELAKREEDAKKQAIERLKDFTAAQENEISALQARNDELFKGSGVLKEASIAQEINKALVNAGTDALSKEGQQIAQNIRLKHELNDAFEKEKTAREEAQAEAERYLEDLAREAEYNQLAFDYWGRSVSENLSDAALHGENLLDVMSNISKQLASRALSNLFLNPLIDGLTSSIGGEAFAKVFGGFRATGGPAIPGRGYVVGEREPEWFEPNTSGTIIPFSKLGDTKPSIQNIWKIDARGSSDPAAMEETVVRVFTKIAPSAIEASVQRMQNSLMRPRTAL